MFVKIFPSMFDGTLATHGPWQAIVTFQQLLILADPAGIVDMTPETIARRTTIPLEIISVGIAALEQPDPESRSPVLDGRRIERLSEARSWGWQIVNYASYRAIRDEDHRREYQRRWAREARAQKKIGGASTPSTFVDTVDRNRPKQRQKQKQNKTIERPKSTVAPSAAFEAFWQAMPGKRRVRKKECAEQWAAKQLDAIASTIMQHVVAMVKTQEWRDGHNPSPLTYIDQDRWGDGIPPALPKQLGL